MRAAGTAAKAAAAAWQSRQRIQVYAETDDFPETADVADELDTTDVPGLPVKTDDSEAQPGEPADNVSGAAANDAAGAAADEPAAASAGDPANAPAGTASDAPAIAELVRCCSKYSSQ